MNWIYKNFSRLLGGFVLLSIILSPLAVLLFYSDIEHMEIPGLIVVVLLLVLFFWQVGRHTSFSANHPREAMKELEENQKSI